MQIQWKFCTLFFIAGLSVGNAFAQRAGQPNPLLKTYIVRVRIGHSTGMCSGGYCETETIVEPGAIRSIAWSSSDKKKLPDRTRKFGITKPDWEDLQNFIDAKVLAAFTGRKGCPACLDQPESWAVLEFSDGTAKSVSYDFSHPPAEIAGLLEKIKAIGAKSKSSPAPI
jgi:hypothetical protein